MAFPLAASDFIDLLYINECKFRLKWNQEGSGTVGGDTIYADRAAPRWIADLTTVELTHAEAAAVMAIINSLNGGLNEFYLYNPTLPYPSSDPTGSIFGAATPVVGSIADRFHAAFTGFPNNYVIPSGTFVQIIFDTSRRYLGQFVGAKTASGVGAVSSAQLAPALPASVVGGNAVTVKKAAGKFKITPDSAYPSTTSPMFQRITFSAEQTYAA